MNTPPLCPVCSTAEPFVIRGEKLQARRPHRDDVSEALREACQYEGEDT